jgi:hypothetical protein
MLDVPILFSSRGALNHMRVVLKRWLASSWEARIAFIQEIRPKHIRVPLPSRPRRRLYVTRESHQVRIVFPWDEEADPKWTGEITFTEREIFRLARLAQGNRTNEKLLEAILAASE